VRLLHLFERCSHAGRGRDLDYGEGFSPLPAPTLGDGHLRTAREPFTFHDLRHSFGTLAVQIYPVTDVQVYMGHEKVETTMRYVHFVPKVDAAAKGSAFIAAQMENVSPLCPEPVTSTPTEANSEQLSAA
jgi:integrase